VKIPLLDLKAQYEGIMLEIRKEIDKIYESHQFILGPVVKEFEEDMQNYLQVKHAIGCASGTDALQLALMSLLFFGVNSDEFDEGSNQFSSPNYDDIEVITTPFTFFATASTIHRVGAKTIFVDIDEKTFNINPELIEKAITEKTKIIMPVHLFGQPAEMDKIMSIAKKYNLKVIEDNAQGIGATYNTNLNSDSVSEQNEQFAGTIGDIGTLSFFPSKNLGAMGDGGMCLTNNDDLAIRLRQLRMHGENPKYFHKWVGLNSRLDSIQAAILKVKLRYLAEWTEGRRRNAAFYHEFLSDVKEIKLPFINEKATSIYNQFTIVCERRDELMTYLQKNDIGCAIYYPLSLHLQECFSYLGGKKGDCPVSEEICKKVLSLPIYGELQKEQIEYIAQKIQDFFK